MEKKEKKVKNYSTLSIRIPNNVLINLRKAKSTIEVAENKTVSLNEMIVMASREYAKVIGME